MLSAFSLLPLNYISVAIIKLDYSILTLVVPSISDSLCLAPVFLTIYVSGRGNINYPSCFINLSILVYNHLTLLVP